MKFWQKNQNENQLLKRSNSEGCIRMASEDDKVSMIFNSIP